MRNILIILFLLPSFSNAQERDQEKSNQPKVDATSGSTQKGYTEPEKLFNGFISGKVKDIQTKKSLEFATVSLTEKRSKKLIEGTITDIKGRFLFENIEVGEYLVTISFIGFEEKTLDVKTTNNKPNFKLKNILLSQNTKMLSEVTIKDEKAIYETRIDKIVYNAEHDLNDSETDATDVLRKAPLLSVDLEGDVSLRGSKNIKFLVNGKASTFFSSDVSTALQMIPADQIKTVEVITSPGAKYDGEGDAGIVNIITKKTIIDGYKATVNGMLSSKVNRTSLDLNIGKGKFGLSTRGGSHGGWPGRIATEYYERSDWENGDTNKLVQNGSGENYYQGYRGNVNAFYDANSDNSFNSSFTFGGRTTIVNNNNTIEYTHGIDDSLSYEKVNTTNKKNKTLNMEWTTDYTKKFASNDDRELVIAFQLGGDINDGNTIIDENQRTLKNYNDEKVIEETFQIDYTHPLGSSKKSSTTKSNTREMGGGHGRGHGKGRKGGSSRISNTNKIEIGGKIINREREMVYSNQGLYNNTEEFNYNQLVSASYISTEFSLAHGLGIKTGIRYENTQISGEWLNNSNDEFLKSYDNILPSFVLSKSFSPMRSIKFSYNQRIRRASVKQINTNEDKTDNRNITIGNPNLEPTVTHQLELGINSFGRILQGSTQVYYKRSDNIIESFLDTINADASISTYKNIGERKQIGGSLFGSINLKKLSFRGSFDIYNYSARDKSLGYKNWTTPVLLYSYFLGGSYDLGKNWKAETFAFFRSPNQTIQGSTTSFSMMSFGIKKVFKNKRGSIGLRVIEPFNEEKEFTTDLQGDYFIQSSVRTIPFRSIGISLKYTIGKLNFKEQKSKSNINNNDIQEESTDEY